MSSSTALVTCLGRPPSPGDLTPCLIRASPARHPEPWLFRIVGAPHPARGQHFGSGIPPFQTAPPIHVGGHSRRRTVCQVAASERKSSRWGFRRQGAVCALDRGPNRLVNSGERLHRLRCPSVPCAIPSPAFAASCGEYEVSVSRSRGTSALS